MFQVITHSLQGGGRLLRTACLLSALLVAPVAQAAAPVSVKKGGYSAPSVALNHSRLLNLAAAPARLSVGDPDIADLLILDSGQVHMLGKSLGVTNVVAWDAQGGILATLDLEVVNSLAPLKRRFHELLPGEKISARTSGRDVILSGEVSSPVILDQAVLIADSFARQSDKEASVVNLMSVGGARQVMLEVKVAEVRRTHLKQLGIKFNAFTNRGNFSFGGVNGGSTIAPYTGGDVASPLIQPGGIGTSLAGDPIKIPDSGIWGPPLQQFTPNSVSLDKGLFASLLTSNSVLNLYIDAARDNDVARVLAEPTLIATSGQKARFIAGGEFPIPVANDENSITIDYKEHGVSLEFEPLVQAEGRISMQLGVNVSELINRNSVVLTSDGSNAALVVPALTKRSANTRVELRDGQSMAIAGLLNETTRDVVNKFPGLGDTPVLGQLFKSQSYQKGQTELVIIVTPRLAKPLDEESPMLPTDTFVDPTDVEFYLLGVAAKPLKKTLKKHNERQRQIRAARMGKLPVNGGPTSGAFGHRFDRGGRR
ncbi:MAG: type II and III secretion system protein family protein [Endozoicomonas sp.]